MCGWRCGWRRAHSNRSGSYLMTVEGLVRIFVRSQRCSFQRNTGKRSAVLTPGTLFFQACHGTKCMEAIIYRDTRLTNPRRARVMQKTIMRYHKWLKALKIARTTKEITSQLRSVPGISFALSAIHSPVTETQSLQARFRNTFQLFFLGCATDE
jgi:hypothetical protein